MSENSLNSPGVFRGQARLATQQDIAHLKEYLEQIIAGPLNEVSDNGYIPWKYNPDGTLDIDYLFPELISRFTSQQGISISTNGVNFANNVTSFNVQGKFVTLDIDENGCLTWTIDEPQVTIPNFNEANMFGTALVKIENDIIEDMIIPDASALAVNSPYGDWEPGTKVKGINWNKSSLYDAIRMTTLGPVFASTTSSYFEVIVGDGNGGIFASFISAPIKANTRGSSRLDAASSQNSTHISIYINEFKEESRGYSFVPVFEINLAKIVGINGGRFNIKIVHHDAGQYSYVSEDMLYNCGAIPSISTTSVQILSDSSSPSSEQMHMKYCSGIRYAKSGTAVVKLNQVYNLNNMAAVEEPVAYSFDLANLDEAVVIRDNYNLDYDKVSTFKIKFKLKNQVLNNDISTGTVVVKNAFGESTPYEIQMPVLLDSQTDLPESDRLHEWFSDESYRVLSNFEIDAEDSAEYSDLTAWDSTKSLTEYDECRGLMVIPGKGLTYPFGNWGDFVPAGSPNYSLNSFLVNEKFFARTFTGNLKVKFGGTFVFEGLTKAQFDDQRLSVIVSCDKGASWMNLKVYRNMESIILKDDGSAMSTIGIMTDVREEDGRLYVSWSYPQGISSNQPLYFKIGMKPTSNFMIKSISLLNADEEEDW